MNSKYVKWAALVALAALPFSTAYCQTTAAPAPAPAISPAASEIIRLAQSGTSDEVMLGYIQNSQTPYNLTADDVVYLKDVGLSSAVITAMLNHDKAAPNQTYVYNQQLYPPTGQTPPGAEPPGPPPLPDNSASAPPPAAALAPAAAPADVSTAPPQQVNYFYNNLSPYGSWVDLEGYGWCWQPSVVVVNHGWRPYCDGGHWVYTDAGWFWASDYSWGWATFHYGRWHQHPRCGWVWFPDTVWAPAWVVWRSTGDSCGWAPLPYGAVYDTHLGFRYNGVSVAAGFDFGLGVAAFTFVGYHDFASHDLVHARYAPDQCERIFHQTTIINNYTVNNNHVVVNHGIPVERISTATHTQIHAVAIHDLPAGSNKPVAREGESSTVYRHELGAPAHFATPVVAQKVNDQHPVIRHGPAVPPSNTAHETASTAHTYTPPAQHNQSAYSAGTHQTAANSSGAYHSETATHAATSSSAAEQSSHIYHPKGYNQASTVHMLPPDPTAAETHSSLPPPPPTSSHSAGGARGQGAHTQTQGPPPSHSQSQPLNQSEGQSQGQSHGQPNQPPK
jgi:hypothetical protein